MGLNFIRTSTGSFRSLCALEEACSTARVLNLRTVYQIHGREDGYIISPFFRNRDLNRAIILKHKVRNNEQLHFSGPKVIATKIIIPIDMDDLRVGGYSAFVGEKNFQFSICDRLNKNPSDLNEDVDLLYLIDSIPTLDPFLLRESLDKVGKNPDQCYFRINDADASRMRDFVEHEIGALVRMSFDGDTDSDKAKILTKKLLSNNGLMDTEALRLTLQMNQEQYREGFFAWKAFLYYRWKMSDIISHSKTIFQEINSVYPVGHSNREQKKTITSMRNNISVRLTNCIKDIVSTLNIYDQAYSKLTKERNPADFKEFLLTASNRFEFLGTKIGAIEHIASFWRYRVPEGNRANFTCDELMDLFYDFEVNLSD